jgi:catechol 2,3-dioxygenase-like lactoylglutathione lyase family enzyme
MSSATLSAPSGVDVRLHVGLHVSDLERSVRFYRTLLGVEPTRRFDELARFEIDRPALVLALYVSPQPAGGALNHVGLRLPDSVGLVEVQRRLEEAGIATQRQEGVECCYARQTKFWVTDPDRVLWEIYTLHEDIDHSGFNDAPHPVVPIATRVWGHRLTEPLPARIDQADNSVDEVSLEGTFNALFEQDRFSAFLAEVHRILRPDGKVIVHALVGSAPFPGTPELPGMASMVQYVPVETEPVNALSAAGFTGLYHERLGDIHCFSVNGVDLREMRLMGWKQAKDMSANRVRIVYKGPFSEVADADGAVYRRGDVVHVSATVADRLRQGPAREQFAYLPCEDTSGSASCGR